jgi:hypothetical protein
MKGCGDVQCLVLKPPSWRTEPDDQQFEIESDYFLTGVGDGSPDGGPLGDITPVRHGVSELWISNTLLEYVPSPLSERGLPFHPTCFEIFKKVSLHRTGKIDIAGLCSWRSHILAYDPYAFSRHPRHTPIDHLSLQWWRHELGTEYLVANPVDVPSLPQLLAKRFNKWPWPEHETWPARGGFATAEPSTLPGPNTFDPFLKLSPELKNMVLGYCSSKDFATLRLVTRAFWEVPMTIFREFLLRDMPWFWEARELPINTTDWPRLYRMAKFNWGNLKGLQNRRRIWADIEILLSRIARYRREGRIPDTDRGPFPHEDGHGGAEFRRQTARRSIGRAPTMMRLPTRRPRHGYTAPDT